LRVKLDTIKGSKLNKEVDEVILKYSHGPIVTKTTNSANVHR